MNTALHMRARVSNERKTWWRGALFGWATLLALNAILQLIEAWITP